VLDAIRARLAECGLELHPTKTKIVYCKDDDRPGEYEHIKFDFLGHSFQPRQAKNRWGQFFISFLPAISAKAAEKIRQTIRDWRMASTRNNQRLEDLAVGPFQLHITPADGAISFMPPARQVPCNARPCSSSPTPCGRACWRARSRPLWLAAAPTAR